MATIKAGDINLEYYVEGSGPPLLMIMGFLGSAASWGEPVLEELRKHFTCIRFSNRGTGESDKPQAQFTIRTMADDAANLLTALKIDRPHLFGISMGGMIAQEFVLAYPQRVNGLVIGCSTPGGSHGVQASPETLSKMAPQPGASPEAIVRAFLAVVCSPGFIKRGAAFLDAMVAQGLERPTPMETMGGQMMAISAFDSYDRLPQIKAKTLVIHGEVDMLAPPQNGKTLVERIPGAELKTIPGAAHMFFWEEPRKTANMVTEFLSKVPVGAK